MKYRKPGLDFWDAWFLEADGEVHAFHMQVPDGTVPLSDAEGRSVGHLPNKKYIKTYPILSISSLRPCS